MKGQFYILAAVIICFAIASMQVAVVQLDLEIKKNFEKPIKVHILENYYHELNYTYRINPSFNETTKNIFKEYVKEKNFEKEINIS
ncbi:MAG: hypothetical protein QW735_00930 [archaeon]